MPFPKKVSDEELILAYSILNNIWKVGEKFNICGQSVQERLIKLNVKLNNPKFSDKEKQILIDKYRSYKDAGNLKELAKSISRTVPFICRKAKELGLTDINHKRPYAKGEKRPDVSERWKKNGHPKGMLNKNHTQKTKDILSIKSMFYQANLNEEQIAEKTMKMLKTKVAKGNSVNERSNTSWKSAWREIGGIKKYYRSKWEANYARYLQFLLEHKEIQKWEHEPETFWFLEIKRGCRSYLPDFRVTEKNGKIEYHEVKGWYDERSITKIKRMKKYHPQIKLILIDAKWFKANNSKLKGLIQGWE